MDHCLRNGYSKSDLSSSAGPCLLSLDNYKLKECEDEKEAKMDKEVEAISQNLGLDSSRVVITRLTKAPENKDEKPVSKENDTVNDIGGLLQDKSLPSGGESAIWEFFTQVNIKQGHFK